METAQKHAFEAAPSPRKRRRGEQDMYAGERLRVARQLAGVSQQQLGDALGVSFQAVQKYESGENRLSAGRLVKAAAFLGVDLVFFAKEQPTSGDALPVTGFTAEEVEIIRIWRTLGSDALRNQVKRLLQALAQPAGGSDTR
jgi:transcriptional regulator with XRE-family HTH domain